jgi:hypothetical protein
LQSTLHDRSAALFELRNGTGKACARLAKAANNEGNGVCHEIQEVLDGLPRAFSKDMYDQKCDLVYQHFYESYMDQGKSVYAVN